MCFMLGYSLIQGVDDARAASFCEEEPGDSSSLQKFTFDANSFWDAKYLEISFERKAGFSNILVALLDQQ